MQKGLLECTNFSRESLHERASTFRFVVKYFFVVMSALIVIGVINGLILLPVLLSLMGAPQEVSVSVYSSSGLYRVSSDPPRGVIVDLHSYRFGPLSVFLAYYLVDFVTSSWPHAGLTDDGLFSAHRFPNMINRCGL